MAGGCTKSRVLPKTDGCVTMPAPYHRPAGNPPLPGSHPARNSLDSSVAGRYWNVPIDILIREDSPHRCSPRPPAGSPSSTSPATRACRSRPSRSSCRVARSSKPETRERVEAAIGRSATSTIAVRPTCARQPSDMVGMVINDLTNPFFAELAVGIERGLQTAGLHPVPGQHRREPGPAGRGDALDARARRGGLSSSARRIGTEPRPLAEMRGLGSAVVTVMRRVPGADGSAAWCRTTAAAPGAPSSTCSASAIAGSPSSAAAPAWWCRRSAAPAAPTALAAAGLAGRPGAGRRGRAQPRRRRRGPAARALALPEPPTAALCFNDVVAFGVHPRPRRSAASRPGATSPSSASTTSPRRGTDPPPLTTVAVDSRRPRRAGRADAAASRSPTQAGRVEHFTGEARAGRARLLRRRPGHPTGEPR